ncbi:MAG: ribosome-associated protein [Enterobacterales bacterium]
MSDNKKSIDLELEEISKTEVKKEMVVLQQLGIKLVELSDSQLNKIPLPENLIDSIKLAKTITKNGGLKRQLKYVGKLMRHVDPEPIIQAMDDIENGHKKNKQSFHLKEQWRDWLLEGGKDKLTEFLNQYPSADMQRLRQLVRNHNTAKTEDKKKQIARQVFKIVTALVT